MPVRIKRVEPDMNPRLVGFEQPLAIHLYEVEVRGGENFVDGVRVFHIEAFPPAVEVILQRSQRCPILPDRHRDQDTFNLEFPTGVSCRLISVPHAARNDENQPKSVVVLEQDNRSHRHLASRTEVPRIHTKGCLIGPA